MAIETKTWTRQELVKFILDMEQRLGVDTWKSDDIYLWPWIRMQLFFFLIRKLEHGKQETFDQQSSGTFVKRLIDSIRQLLRFYRIGQTEILFVGARSHRGEWQGTSYNKFFDPVRLTNEVFKRSVLAEYSPSTRNSTGTERIFSFTDVLFLLRFFLPRKKADKDLLGYRNQVIDYLHAQLPGIKTVALEKRVIANWIQLATAISAWELVLKRLRPKKILTLCYYQVNVYALNVAASKLKIPTIEMQHGPINSLHLAYGSFEHLPHSSRSALLPDTFLSWETESMRSLKKSFPQKDAIVVGQPWANFLESKAPILPKTKKVITYAVQPVSIGEIFPAYLVKWIRESLSEYSWRFRLHPRQFK
jgi:hypothetical protein